MLASHFPGNELRAKKISSIIDASIWHYEYSAILTHKFFGHEHKKFEEQKTTRCSSYFTTLAAEEDNKSDYIKGEEGKTCFHQQGLKSFYSGKALQQLNRREWWCPERRF